MPLLELDLEENWVELILSAHDAVEDGDLDGDGGADQRHDDCGLRVRHVVVNEEQEVQMDQVLWPILSQQGPDTHNPSECHWLFANLSVVVDAERVKNSSHQHVLTNEANIAVPLNLWQRMIEGFGELEQSKQAVQGIDDIQQDESSDWNCQVPLFALI